MKINARARYCSFATHFSLISVGRVIYGHKAADMWMSSLFLIFVKEESRVTFHAREE